MADVDWEAFSVEEALLGASKCSLGGKLLVDVDRSEGDLPRREAPSSWSGAAVAMLAAS